MAEADTPLPPGKLPAELLDGLLSRYVTHDPSVVVGPGIGRDAAAVRVGERIIVVKTDPITFATDDAGRYLVNVNANDIACMGATPRWLLVTALLPERTTTPRLVEESFRSLAEAAREAGVSLVGGHSEITLGIDRVILVGQMIGDAAPDELIDPANAEPGDVVVLCGGIAIEGTALLAREATAALTALPYALRERASQFLTTPGISVLPAARALAASAIRPKALHDPTEGGLATALAEVAMATGCGIAVERKRIHVYDETRAICGLLGLDPLGLIASGALLAVLAPQDVDPALAALHAAGVSANPIGTLTADPRERTMCDDGERTTIPGFPVDEIARYFAGA